ncbi:basic proline-rich protein-like [Cervus elaphus]|uniref:basic proline-rich protein-like n=1 Tax=Cervus elaphus TaxID=9860 RepID=UPI001CC2A82D|nr:basic proline-rich protein-like [Cervus elaphus]
MASEERSRARRMDKARKMPLRDAASQQSELGPTRSAPPPASRRPSLSQATGARGARCPSPSGPTGAAPQLPVARRQSPGLCSYGPSDGAANNDSREARRPSPPHLPRPQAARTRPDAFGSLPQRPAPPAARQFRLPQTQPTPSPPQRRPRALFRPSRPPAARPRYREYGGGGGESGLGPKRANRSRPQVPPPPAAGVTRTVTSAIREDASSCSSLRRRCLRHWCSKVSGSGRAIGL